MSGTLDRRSLLAAVLGTPAAMIAGCSSATLPAEGRLLAPNHELGHAIRDRKTGPDRDRAVDAKVKVAIVGGGIAGLAAARRLAQAGIDEFVVLEMEQHPGGTARYGSDGVAGYPWGAHYVPAPMADNSLLVDLFDEMGVLRKFDQDGTPIVAEQFLCRDPQERVFVADRWYQGLYPEADAGDEDLRQLSQFRSEIDAWVARRDGSGRRPFAIPSVNGSSDPEVLQLDRVTMADFLRQRGWNSSPLRWLVDYSCRDDYGIDATKTSAWAGMFYFAARLRAAGGEYQPVVTWPEGNGRIVRHLCDLCGDRLRLGHAVTEITPGDESDDALITVLDTAADRKMTLSAGRVIYAAPQFLRPYLLAGDTDPEIARTFRYGSWLVANVHLSRRPQERGFPMSWDNVIYGSKSLGYVTSTHQLGIDHGPTILTWYYPLSDLPPEAGRRRLLSLDWEVWADLVLADLEVPHPDIRALVTRLDVMRWGHAMIQPRVGMRTNSVRKRAAQPTGRLHFAGTDLSGIALLEEAFHHGVRAADEVIATTRVATF